MSQDLASRYRNRLTQQLTMNRSTWALLQSHGVTTETRLRLDFCYRAPDKIVAEALKAVLDDETDYSVVVQLERKLVPIQWNVLGSTEPTTVSPEILDQWVDWITAGLHQNCDIDGWGVEVCD